MKKINILATASLLLTAAIWGLSYSAQSEAMKTMPPLFFVFLRYIIGTVMLLPVIFIMRKKPVKNLIPGGIACGICLAGGEILQQFGLLYTSAGKAGFLTALYVIMIPLIGIFVKRKSDWKIWTASLVSLGGTYLLCSDGSLKSFGNPGDWLMLLCALFFAFQFIFIARFAPEADALQLAAVQFFTVAVISGIATLIAGENCSMQSVSATVKPLLYCGVIAIGFACTVQIAAQKYVHPATTSIVLSTASVFAVIWGWWLLGESYSVQNLIGCAMIFGAVVLVQLPPLKASQAIEASE
ncbi:MAG: DMT family transporter [Lentisphaeria bacterium]|nr:DMT family transporter [Lentisphaerota bacterium]MBR7145039.1 DMT family transporter [Lentisphaeria bacterium]